MNIFSQTSYRDALQAIVKERKQLDRAFGFHALADAARIQRPYLSKVMKGTAHLNTDQLFLISTFLKLTTDECDYLQLLLDHERTIVAERKSQLAKKIKILADRHNDIAAHLRAKAIDPRDAADSLTDYYLDPLNQVVHIAISIDYFSKNPLALAAELSIPGAQLHAIVATLERLGLAYREGSRLRPREPSTHLSKHAPVYRAARNQNKLLSTVRINQLSPDEVFSFSTIFSADMPTRKDIDQRFLEFLKSCQGTVSEAPAHQVYQMSFDVFPWTSSRPP